MGEHVLIAVDTKKQENQSAENIYSLYYRFLLAKTFCIALKGKSLSLQVNGDKREITCIKACQNFVKKPFQSAKSKEWQQTTI